MKLLFVYNANSGAINAVVASAHKLLSPKSYQCSLCDITFGAFTEKDAWKGFRESAPVAMEFLHKDEFLRQYRSKWLPKFTFPIVISEEKNALHVFITTDQLNAIQNVEALIAAIENRLN